MSGRIINWLLPLIGYRKSLTWKISSTPVPPFTDDYISVLIKLKPYDSKVYQPPSIQLLFHWNDHTHTSECPLQSCFLSMSDLHPDITDWIAGVFMPSTCTQLSWTLSLSIKSTNRMISNTQLYAWSHQHTCGVEGWGVYTLSRTEYAPKQMKLPNKTQFYFNWM